MGKKLKLQQKQMLIHFSLKTASDADVMIKITMTACSALTLRN